MKLPDHLQMTHLDLFSGIGGFTLAAQWAGFRTIGFSEIDEYASKVLEKNWPGIKNYGDIKNVRGLRADLVTGGFPCQGFSCAGKRRGKEDERHLWPEMCRVIKETGPAWVLAENVPGIISMELDSVLSDLENIGYTCWPLVIPACAVDAKHRRDRVWIVANAAGIRRQQTTDGREQRQSVPELGCEDVPDTGCNRQGCGERVPRREAKWGERSIDAANGLRWPAEPELGRVAHGIPNRVDRLRGLGNAIVPQVAFRILKSIYDIEVLH